MELPMPLRFLMAGLLSIVVSYIVYFGFTPNYTRNVFNEHSFRQQYDQGLYRYRILSKELVLSLHSALQARTPAQTPKKRFLVLDDHASNLFYITYFIVNAVFLLLSSLLLVLILDLAIFRITNHEKSLLLFLIVVVVGLTQFVIMMRCRTFYIC
jgi:4-amino-4-deoxy-L-arabinose transferase-like glycosyltransferase